MAFQQQSTTDNSPEVPRGSEKSHPGSENVEKGFRGGQRNVESDGKANGEDVDGHVGATDDQVLYTPAPSGEPFEDEPRQG